MTNTSLIELLNNGTKNYVLTDEGYISNHLVVNIKKDSDGTLELSQLYLVEKIINHVGLELSASIKSRDTPTVKPLLYKGESSTERICVWNYRATVGMLSDLGDQHNHKTS